MASYTWIKLYIEILDDSKIGMLPDALKWRMVQLFLVARERNKDGLLGMIKQLSWRLRISEDEILADLKSLSEIGIVKETIDGWLVVNFAKRQKPIGGKERVNNYRERTDVTNRYNNCNENVTRENIDSISISDSISDSNSLINESDENKKVKEEEPALLLFTDRFGKFRGGKELKRWLVIVDAVGYDQADTIAEWAEKKEIHLDNRPGLITSMETAAKTWKEKNKPAGKTILQKLAEMT